MSRLVQPTQRVRVVTETPVVTRSGTTETRQVVETKVVAGDGFAERIAKYVPAEILAGYIAVDGYLVPNPEVVKSVRRAVAGGAEPTSLVQLHPPQTSEALMLLTPNLPLIAFVLFLIITPAYFWQLSRKAPAGTPWVSHAILATLAFVVWAYAMRGSVFTAWLDALPYDAKIASAFMFIFSIVSGIFSPRSVDAEDVPPQG
jgi:hypothetical protein